MIAAVERPGILCIVLWVGRVGLHAEALTYCNVKVNAGNGTVQVPDVIFREGKAWQGVADDKPHKPCQVCKQHAGI